MRPILVVRPPPLGPEYVSLPQRPELLDRQELVPHRLHLRIGLELALEAHGLQQRPADLGLHPGHDGRVGLLLLELALGLARALAVDADIILMDEPFSSVDEQTRRKFQEELLDLLRHKRKTVIFVTHSIEEAAYLSDQIVLLTPRPGTVSKIIRPGIDRSQGAEEIRRDRRYLDAVDEIWQILKHYVT